MPAPGESKQVDPYSESEEQWLHAGVRLMTVLNVWLYKLSGGRLGDKFRFGAPVCLIKTTGRKSGKQRTIALIYLERGDEVIVVASKGGSARTPAWSLNLDANPECEVTIGGETRVMTTRRASDEEKAKLWDELNAVYPEYEDYQARTTRNIPVHIMTPLPRRA